MACLSSIHHAIARLQAVSAAPVPPDLICVGPLRSLCDRKIQVCAQFKSLRAGSSVSSGLCSKLLVFATAAAAGQDTATSTLVLQEVDFVWKGEASEVLLTGDFLDWETKVSLLKGDDGVFHFKQKLSPGTYKYKFIIDGEWIHSPYNPTISDGQGGFNNQITITDGASAAAKLTNSQSSAEGSSPTASAKGMASSAATAKVSSSAEGTSPTASAKGTADSGTAAKVSSSAEGTSPTASAKGTADSGTAAKVSSSAEGASPTASAKGTAGSGTAVKASSSTESTSPTTGAKGPAVSGAAAKASSNAEGSPPQAAPKVTPAARPAKKASTEKPYPQIIIEDVIPKIKSSLQKEKDISDVDVVFQDNQLEGSFMKKGIIYTFWAFFPDGKLEGSRGFSFSSHGTPPSTVEPFMIDEKKFTADLLVFWIMKRLFAEKLLSLN